MDSEDGETGGMMGSDVVCLNFPLKRRIETDEETQKGGKMT